MDELVTDIERLESALRELFQAMKQPLRWTRLAAAADTDIDRSGGVMLQILHRHSSDEAPFQVQDLARRLNIEAPSVTRRTQELEQLGLLRRLQNRRDRRAVDLHITERGSALAERLWQAQRVVWIDSLKDWSPKERGEFVGYLERFAQTLSKDSGPPQPNDYKPERHEINKKGSHGQQHTN
jgi:DNA-binding MarR family transcriptional regulator